MAAQSLVSNRSGVWRRLLRLLMALSWPFRVVILSAWIYLYPKASRTERLFHRWLDFVGSCRLSLFERVPVMDYRRLELDRAENRAQLSDYVFTSEIHFLQGLCEEQDRLAIEDKHFFAGRCSVAALRHVPTLALFGPTAPPLDPGEMPRSALVLKPRVASRMRGIKSWTYEKEHWKNESGRLLNGVEVLREIHDWTRSEEMVLQPLLESHPALVDLSLGLCPTVRIVTLRCQRGEVTPLLPVFQMPMMGGALPNCWFSVPIDPLTGRLVSSASPRTPLVHPHNESVLLGRELPYWDQAIKLVLAAHDLFPTAFSLGWDLAWTAEGPTLLETNLGWDVASLQRLHGSPLARTEFSPLVLERIRSLNED